MVFLGKEIATHKDYSENTAIAIDQEVRSLAEGCYQRAAQLLKDNEDKLHLIARALLEREVLAGEEMERLLRGEILAPLPPPSDGSAPATAAASEGSAVEKSRPVEGFPPPHPRPAGA
jgi:cell division protease FtsH